jgi:hypothetical protein
MTNEVKNNKPEYSGYIQDGLGNTIGNIAVWKVLEAQTEKSPSHTGKIEVEGVRYKVVLWKN